MRFVTRRLAPPSLSQRACRGDNSQALKRMRPSPLSPSRVDQEGVSNETLEQPGSGLRRPCMIKR